uniref:Secreted protein n=1 Tax=Haemonchus placei TaxID=6290 RepID=A0A158QK96_HAEPC
LLRLRLSGLLSRLGSLSSVDYAETSVHDVVSLVSDHVDVYVEDVRLFRLDAFSSGSFVLIFQFVSLSQLLIVSFRFLLVHVPLPILSQKPK